MNDSSVRFRLGVFVLSAVFLLLASLFFLGLSDLFTNKIEVRTCFTESVQGLNVGSPVKYRGVPIGSVTDIVIQVSEKLVQVDMDIDLDKFIGTRGGRSSQKEFLRFFRKDLKQGLRCRLEYTGITGLRYVDFDYFAPLSDKVPETPAILTQGRENTLYIPAVPSAFRDILRALNSSLDRISRIRFDEISYSLERNLKEVSHLLSDPALKGMIFSISEAAENLQRSTRTINRVLNEQRLNELLGSLQKNFYDINKLTNLLISESKAAKIAESTAAFRDASESLAEGQEQLSNSIDKLNRTLDSLKALSDNLKSEPESVLRSRRKIPVKMER